MGDCFYKKRKEGRQKREVAVRENRGTVWLILCEGKETEVNYFTGLADYLNRNGKNEIKIKPIGLGMNPTGIANMVEEFNRQTEIEIRKANIKYGKVVIVFDKDDFKAEDFNNAAFQERTNRDIHYAAWSNECFELWLWLHFKPCSAALHRNDINKKLTKIFIENGILKKNEKYQKNDKEIFEKIIKNGGSVKRAIRNSKRLMEGKAGLSPADINPGTCVYKVVEALAEEAGYEWD